MSRAPTSALDEHTLIRVAVTCLNSQLPLKARQDALSPAWKSLHRQILRFLATQGRPPDSDELSKLTGRNDLAAGLQRLGTDDLIVLAPKSRQILGAYPLTSEVTPHKVMLNGHSLYAMCALDAVSVAPMFATEVRIESSCHMSKTPIAIHMRGSDILAVQPDERVMVGVRWQMPTAIAAHSMCLQMVFLKNRPTAEAWQNGDSEHASIFTLPQAVTIGRTFFLPLLV